MTEPRGPKPDPESFRMGPLHPERLAPVPTPTPYPFGPDTTEEAEELFRKRMAGLEDSEDDA
jgi:hypothetical protein